LRFAAPQPPAINRAVVNNGSVGRICPQSNPAWLATAAEFVPDYLATGKTNFTAADFASASSTGSKLPAQE